jgi:hypothetical protein
MMARVCVSCVNNVCEDGQVRCEDCSRGLEARSAAKGKSKEPVRPLSELTDAALLALGEVPQESL